MDANPDQIPCLMEMLDVMKESGCIYIEYGVESFSEDVMEVLDITCTGKWNSKVLRPYPNSPIGDGIYSKYNVTSNKWEFLLRFIWWEQIENFENCLGIEHDLSLKDEILFGEYEQSKEKSYTIITKYTKMEKDRR